jgi:hypothetical protein
VWDAHTELTVAKKFEKQLSVPGKILRGLLHLILSKQQKADRRPRVLLRKSCQKF